MGKSKSHSMVILCAFKFYYIHCVYVCVLCVCMCQSVHVGSRSNNLQLSGISFLLHLDYLGDRIPILSLGGKYIKPLSQPAGPQSVMSYTQQIFMKTYYGLLKKYQEKLE